LAHLAPFVRQTGKANGRQRPCKLPLEDRTLMRGLLIIITTRPQGIIGPVFGFRGAIMALITDA